MSNYLSLGLSLGISDFEIDMQYFSLYPYIERDHQQFEYQERLYKDFVRKYGHFIFTAFKPFQVEIVSILGRGAFGTVYLIRMILNDKYTTYALKLEQINTALYDVDTFRRKVKTEFQMQKRVEKLGYALPITEYGFFDVYQIIHSFILMNVLSPNVHSCSEFVSNAKMLPTEFTYILLRKIAKACLALETNKIVHGDFHWGNIIVSVKNAYIDIPFKKLTEEQFDIILIDFGFSTDLIPELNNYDLNSLYISSLSYSNVPKFRSRLRKLMMKRTSISESILLNIQSFYKMYAMQKEILFQKLNLD